MAMAYGFVYELGEGLQELPRIVVAPCVYMQLLAQLVSALGRNGARRRCARRLRAYRAVLGG